ncbi:hypothetical protein DPMN_088407 [Dreissena polymorpha]|uniref:Uncharacterized protein n=1 Tax=Dreissena polymorpha TaxID=45954 RepID=A0A9D4KU14_DREPO|nr:hypothetical protein DPMN_088407 [Dreissena polymorpha]
MIRQVNKTGVSGVIPPESTLILIQQTELKYQWLSAWGFSRKTVDCPLKVMTEGLVLRVFCRPVVVGLGIFKKNCRLPPNIQYL